MRNNPRDWRIEDLRVVAHYLGIDYEQHGTSHCTFRHPKAGRLTVPAHAPVKPVYVRQFAEFATKVESDEDEI